MFGSCLGFALLLGGCPDPIVRAGVDAGVDAASICATGYLGDPAAEPIVELRALRADGTDVELKDGDDLAVIFPPQGGRVAFVGVRVLNMDGCAMQITGALRDPATKQLRLDGRTVNLRRQDDGYGVTGRGTGTNIADSDEIGDYSNVPLCPNQWADRDVFDQPFELEVLLLDRGKKTVTKRINVVPRCAEPGEKKAACTCLCRKGYILGQLCGEDAGVDAGSP